MVASGRQLCVFYLTSLINIMAACTRSLLLSLHTKRPHLLINHLHRCVINQNRCFSSTVALHGKTPRVNSSSSNKVEVLAKAGIMARFENTLEARYPKVYKIYMLIKLGVKDFYVDTKTLYSVSSQVWKGKNTTKFSFNELDVYRRMPRDLLRVGPIVVLLNLPITDIIMPFLVFAFPRYLLCQHFWTPEQKLKFGERDLQTQVPQMPSVLQAMDVHRLQVTDSGYRKLIDDIMYKLEQKDRPSMEEILEIKPIFRDGMPFGLPLLSSQHKSHLAKSLAFSTWSRRLIRQATLLHHTDLALVKEGVNSLSAIRTKQACFLRGLNAANCTDQEAAEYLATWTQISRNVDDKSLSLLLHCPVFLALNHPANTQLLK